MSKPKIKIKYHPFATTKEKTKLVNPKRWDKFQVQQKQIANKLLKVQKIHISEKFEIFLDIENFINHALTSYSLAAIFIASLFLYLTNPLIGGGIMLIELLSIVLWGTIATYSQRALRNYERRCQLHTLSKLAREEALFIYLNNENLKSQLTLWNKLTSSQQKSLADYLPNDSILKNILLTLSLLNQDKINTLTQNEEAHINLLKNKIWTRYLKKTYKSHLEAPKPPIFGNRVRYVVTALSTLSTTIAVSSIVWGFSAVVINFFPILFAAPPILLTATGGLLIGVTIALSLTFFKQRREMQHSNREKVIHTLKEQHKFKHALQQEITEVQILIHAMLSTDLKLAKQQGKQDKQTLTPTYIQKYNFWSRIDKNHGNKDLLVAKNNQRAKSLSCPNIAIRTR